MDNKSQQNDEVELLQSIMFDSLTIEQTDPYHILKMDIKSDTVENPELEVIFEVEFTENYPSDELFKYKVYETRNRIIPAQFKQLYTDITQFSEENMGSPIVYQLVEMIKEFINPLEEKRQEVDISKQKEEELKEQLKKQMNNMELINKKLIETKKFTPVTKENYQEWFDKYMKEKIKEGGKELKQRKEILSRTSGRDFFMILKNKEIDENNEEGDDGEDIDYDLLKDQKKKEVQEKMKQEGKEYNDEDYDEDNDEDFNPDLFEGDDVDLEELDDVDFDDEE